MAPLPPYKVKIFLFNPTSKNKLFIPHWFCLYFFVLRIFFFISCIPPTFMYFFAFNVNLLNIIYPPIWNQSPYSQASIGRYKRLIILYSCFCIFCSFLDFVPFVKFWHCFNVKVNVLSLYRRWLKQLQLMEEILQLRELRFIQICRYINNTFNNILSNDNEL